MIFLSFYKWWVKSFVQKVDYIVKMSLHWVLMLYLTKRTYQERYVILVIVFITIIMKIIQSICHHDGLKQLYVVHFSIYCFSKHCHKQDNKVVILVSSILRVVIPIWLQNVLNVDDNLDRKLENKIFNYILIFFSALTIHLFV